MNAALPLPVSAAALLGAATDRTALRFITCGSVDDGKSTLIGRLLHESSAIFEDQEAALRADSKRRWGTNGEEQDYALLVDGLEAEREQGITIDVAYRFFSTPRRAFIVADTPGHAQYTRNMATGASTAQMSPWCWWTRAKACCSKPAVTRQLYRARFWASRIIVILADEQD